MRLIPAQPWTSRPPLIGRAPMPMNTAGFRQGVPDVPLGRGRARWKLCVRSAFSSAGKPPLAGMIVVSGRVRIDNLKIIKREEGRAILRRRCFAVRRLFSRASYQSRQCRDVRGRAEFENPLIDRLPRRAGVSPGGGQAQGPSDDVVAWPQSLLCDRAYRHVGRPAWEGDRELHRKSTVASGSWTRPSMPD